MLSLHTHTPLLIHLHATLYWSDPNSSSSSGGTGTGSNSSPHVFLRSQKLPPVAFAADVVVPDSTTTTTTTTTANTGDGHGYRHGYGHGHSHADTDTDADADATLFLRSLDASCLARVRAMTRHTAYRFERPVNYEVERAFVWAGMSTGKAAAVSKEVVPRDVSLPMRGLSGAELGRQVEMVRLRGYRDWVRVEMAVEIEGGEGLRGRGEVVRVWGEGWEAG